MSDCDYYSVGVDQDGDQQQSDFDKSFTIPRSGDISQSYRRLFQSKRPASTAGVPSNGPAVTPGVATIRRAPTSKPTLRRPLGLGLGPIPIKSPMIPVKTPTVPEHPFLFSSGGTIEENERGGLAQSPLSPRTPLSPGSNGLLSPKTNPWDGAQRLQGQGPGSDPPTPPPQPGGRLSEWDRQPLPEVMEETETGEVEDVLVAIRRGVKLKRTTTSDRSAPQIH